MVIAWCAMIGCIVFFLYLKYKRKRKKSSE